MSDDDVRRAAEREPMPYSEDELLVLRGVRAGSADRQSERDRWFATVESLRTALSRASASPAATDEGREEAIRDAVLKEREACQVDVCLWCRVKWPIATKAQLGAWDIRQHVIDRTIPGNTYHWNPNSDGSFDLDDVVRCDAAEIRARSGQRNEGGAK